MAGCEPPIIVASSSNTIALAASQSGATCRWIGPSGNAIPGLVSDRIIDFEKQKRNPKKTNSFLGVFIKSLSTGWFFIWLVHGRFGWSGDLGFVGFYWVSVGFTGFYWVLLLSIDRFDRVFFTGWFFFRWYMVGLRWSRLGLTSVGFTGFYWVLLLKNRILYWKKNIFLVLDRVFDWMSFCL